MSLRSGEHGRSCRLKSGSPDVLVKYKTEFNIGLKTAILGGNTSVEDSDAHGDAKP